ncbi:MAG: pyridoxamine 5'-phosphate oxidase family protein [Chitinispirillales bacterium]|jgi:general stress protein 26|nr:pyridoxamine 5'-phosphate oxidase family protein [Chitinispirillales bacterium]
MNQKTIDKAVKAIAEKTGGGNEGHCVLALIDMEGYPTASTLSLSKADGIREMTFCVELESNKVRRINNCNRASVCFSSEKYNITLVGTIDILTDPQVKKEMWYDCLENIFTGGAGDPNYCVLRFKTKSYNLFFTDEYDHASGTL